jgi:hypothetical protein
MLPLIHWSVVLDLNRMPLPRSEQKRLEHLAELKHIAEQTEPKASRPPKAEADTVTASCCPQATS